ncbi:hypothetical protein NDU88_001103 [Pleurodeles waltl]|uniref:Uncharacterized protein n=1 Tax=Pleurodeles waltl TaxID=8319 RepID=A0AAV7V8K3_PLEWA|nr:hypothetical protein NDU88_001103 [Pleurodeles waltl]
MHVVCTRLAAQWLGGTQEHLFQQRHTAVPTQCQRLRAQRLVTPRRARSASHGPTAVQRRFQRGSPPRRCLPGAETAAPPAAPPPTPRAALPGAGGRGQARARAGPQQPLLGDGGAGGGIGSAGSAEDAAARRRCGFMRPAGTERPREALLSGRAPPPPPPSR